jgi:DNA-binding NarL/FixJ family response regulator
MIRCVISNPSRFIRECAAFALDAGEITVVGTFDNVVSAVHACIEHNADILFHYLHMRGSIYETLEAAGIRTPNFKVIVTSLAVEPEWVCLTKSLGCQGYISGDLGLEELRAVVLRIYGGSTYFPDTCAPDCTPENPCSPVSKLMDLTPRERIVLKLLAEGTEAKEVAKSLVISQKTMEAHKYSGMRKLGVRTMAELMRFAVQHRMLDPRQISNSSNGNQGLLNLITKEKSLRKNL